MTGYLILCGLGLWISWPLWRGIANGFRSARDDQAENERMLGVRTHTEYDHEGQAFQWPDWPVERSCEGRTPRARSYKANRGD